jgi:L-alanine-DL-glutamate epimerase-like enolase superfamily enzyme
VTIERVEVHPVAIPLGHPYRDATRVETHSRDVVVRLLAGGAEGWGAGSPRSFPTGETQVGAVHVLEAYLAPAITGLDPSDTAAVHDAMARAIPGNMAAKAAVDIALHDLVGRMSGRPVHELLGGLVRASMATLDILPLEPPARIAELAEERRRTGTRAFKVKLDADIAMGLERIAAVRSVAHDAMIVADANGAWAVEDAIAICERLAAAGVDVVEQPVPGEDIEGLARVTRGAATRIAADESVRPEFVARLIATRAVHIVNVKVTREGGLVPARAVALAAAAAGMQVVTGSLVHTGLIDVAAAHLFASLPAVAYNESGKAPLWHPHDIVTGLRIEDGEFHVPLGPGLGVDVDRDAVERFRPVD